MNNALAKRLYRAMPRPARKATFYAFARAVQNKVKIKDFGNYVAELHLSELMEIAAYLDEFEPEVSALIERFVKPGMVAIDIGANVGLHALRIASRAGEDGRVFAFEPVEYSFRKLERNISLNPHLNIEPIRIALSSESKKAVEIDFRTSWRTDGGRSDTTPSVADFMRLDDWVVINELEQIDLAKIDVDGFEGLILEGGMETFSKFRPIVLIEAFEGQFKDGRPNAFTILESLGYALWIAKGEKRIRADEVRPLLRELAEAGVDSFNLLALPQ